MGVKIAAVHNVAPIASGIVRAGADYIAIDGLRGGTGAAPTIIRNNVGIPIELAIAAVDTRLREEGIRNQVSLLAAGSIRNSADVVKVIALGADAVYIGTGALVALGCHLCQKCYTGKCNWGIATQDPYLTKRLNPNIGSRRLANLIRAWSLEIKEMLGGMGVNAIESLRGNRDHLRGVGLNEVELAHAGHQGGGRTRSDETHLRKRRILHRLPAVRDPLPGAALAVEKDHQGLPEEAPRAMPRLLVEEEGPLSFAMQCRHCEDAPCLEACITGAMHRDEETGAVLCDEDKCVGCWMCVMVCPFGAIQRNVSGRKAASKCDLCYGEEMPGLRGPLPQRGAGLCRGVRSADETTSSSATRRPRVGAVEAHPPPRSGQPDHHRRRRAAPRLLAAADLATCWAAWSTKPACTIARRTSTSATGWRRCWASQVTRVRPRSTQAISLAGGGTLPYDRLLIATGGTPFVPPSARRDLEGVFTFTALGRRAAHRRYIETRNVRVGAGRRRWADRAQDDRGADGARHSR